MDLDRGKVAVVTGAASGIGLALVEAFAGRGLSVVMADVDEAALGQAGARIAGGGADVLTVRTDVSKEADVQALAAAAVERFGPVHVVCNNAGVAGKSDAWFGPISGWEWVLGVNLWGVIHGIRAFLPVLFEGGGGHIVNTASIAGVMPGFGAAYDASKHAVVALSEDLYNQMTMAELPIGVSVLCPGWVRTGIFDSERNWPAEYGEPPELDLAYSTLEAHFRRAIDEGTTPAAIADHVVRAVQDDRFWIFPHADFLEVAMRRFHRIEDGLDPEPVAAPGMPSTDEMVQQVKQALGL